MYLYQKFRDLFAPTFFSLGDSTACTPLLKWSSRDSLPSFHQRLPSTHRLDQTSFRTHYLTHSECWELNQDRNQFPQPSSEKNLTTFPTIAPEGSDEPYTYITPFPSCKFASLQKSENFSIYFRKRQNCFPSPLRVRFP